MTSFDDLLSTTLDKYKPEVEKHLFEANPLFEHLAAESLQRELEWWTNATWWQKARHRLRRLRWRIEGKLLSLKDRLCGCSEEW